MIMPVSRAALTDELIKIGIHPDSLAIFTARAAIEPLKIFNVRTPAANIIKQELLSVGADCALHQGCVSGRVLHTDIVLLGTLKAYRELLRKLLPMNFFGLPEISAELKNHIERQSPRTVLADGRVLNYDKLLIMGIVNLTPDSFYPPSRRAGQGAVDAAGKMLGDGADVIDLGAQSTRPGARPVSQEEELDRLLPVVRGVKKAYPDSILSIDTYYPAVMRAALKEGADIINDITGGTNPEMASLAAETKAPLIIMHMQGQPQTMQDNPRYGDVVKEVAEFFLKQSAALSALGVGKDKLIVDPGIGFGKAAPHNLELLRRMGDFGALGFPVLLAASRKRVIADVLGEDKDRLPATIALSCRAAAAGVNIVRVHDVRENLLAVRMTEAVCR